MMSNVGSIVGMSRAFTVIVRVATVVIGGMVMTVVKMMTVFYFP